MTDRKRQIAPSMMCADFLDLGIELARFERLGVEWLHVDVMDGRYAPNFTLGIDYCRALQEGCAIPLDIHLMIERPDLHVAPFLELPRPVRLTFHPETLRQPVRLLERLREGGASPGVAIDPGMTLESVRHLLGLVDQVLIMTVNPGYAGQKLIPFTLDKIAEARERLASEGLEAQVSVDGNVSWENIPKMKEAGADIFVAGTSSLFAKGADREASIARLRALLA